MNRQAGVDEQARRGIASIALLCELAEDLQRPGADLLEAAGITSETIADPSATVTARQELAAIKALLVDSDDPARLGLVAGQRYRLTTYGIWSYALLSSATFREALEVGLGHVGLTFVCTTVTLDEGPDSMQLTFVDWPLDESVRRFVLVRDTIAAVGIIHGITGPQISPRRVELAIPDPPEPEAYAQAFGAETVFNCESSALIFEKELLEMPMPQASELTARMCLQQCRELLDARSTRKGLSGEVRDLLVSSPGRIPGQQEVAERLHMSVRNLRRRLGQEGTSYRELVDQTRRTLAEDLLMTGRLTVDQVAVRVGYADTSAFVHAFRRWNDDAPKRWAAR